VGRRLGNGLLLAAAAGLTGAVHGQMPVEPRALRGDGFVPRPELARATSLGFDAVVSDYYWLQAVQAVGGSMDPESKGYLLAGLLDVVTTLDPWVDHPYRFAAVWLTDSLDSVRKANELLRRGIAHHPGDWRNYFYLGFNHFFYLDQRAEAADVLEQAIALPDAPLYLRRLVARLKSAEGGLAVAETFLHGLALEAETDDERAQYEKALGEIATERVARELDAARARYRERHGRDIAAVEDLLRGPDPILPALPRDPQGGSWTLDPWTGAIVSDAVGSRYDPRVDPVTQRRIDRVRQGGAPGTRAGADAPKELGAEPARGDG
jgi:hypothetical protein